MSEPEVQANLRIPASLRDKLKAAAKENRRSMTAEVVARLEESFWHRPPTEAYEEMLGNVEGPGEPDYSHENLAMILAVARHSLTHATEAIRAAERAYDEETGHHSLVLGPDGEMKRSYEDK